MSLLRNAALFALTLGAADEVTAQSEAKEPEFPPPGVCILSDSLGIDMFFAPAETKREYSYASLNPNLMVVMRFRDNKFGPDRFIGAVATTNPGSEDPDKIRLAARKDYVDENGQQAAYDLLDQLRPKMPLFSPR